MKFIDRFLYQDNNKYIVLIRKREYRIRREYGTMEEAKNFINSLSECVGQKR